MSSNFPRLHKMLKIPEGYIRLPHHTASRVLIPGSEPVPPQITRLARAAAIRDLVGAGVLKDSSNDALMDAICERLGKLPNRINIKRREDEA